MVRIVTGVVLAALGAAAALLWTLMGGYDCCADGHQP